MERTQGIRGRRRSVRERGETYAALDLGTNNCRLLVAHPTADGFRVVDAFSRIIRLGEGLSVNGRLSEAAIDRAVDALKVCAAKMRRRRVTRSRHVATEACRRAANCDSFLARVAEETGITLEIISAEEEAGLALRSSAALLDRGSPRALIFDIGGGSTEIIWLATGEVPEIIASISLPCGVVTMAERHGGHEVSRATFDAIAGEVRRLLEPFEACHGIRDEIAAGRAQMLGTSGTVTTFAGVFMDLPRYERARVDGCYLDFAECESVVARLLAMSHAERAAHPCIGPERADLVVPGAAIFAAIAESWPVGRLRVADRGLREGILLGLMGRAP
ncbi:MAG: Ppx/GppA phosphatase family protein [Alphaproteobacteria bacterium]